MRSAERVMVAQPRWTAISRPARWLLSEQGALYPLLYLAPFLAFFLVFQVYPSSTACTSA